MKYFRQKNKGFTRTPKFGVTPRGGGFTLVETLVSISIFTMSILGLMTVLSQGIVDIGYAKKKIMAGYLAQEGIEYVRNMRDTYVLYTPLTGWGTFKSADKTYPITDLDFAGFSRTITTAPGSSGDEVKISSTVSWSQASGDYSITLSENLFNWWQ